MSHLHSLRLVFILLIILFLVVGIAAVAPTFGGRLTLEGQPQQGIPIVARVSYDSIQDLERLQSYDIWEYNNLEERFVLVSTDYAGLERLAAEGWRFEIDQPATERLQQAPKEIFNFNGSYRTVAELHDRLVSIQDANPTLTEVVDYGDSYCKTTGGCITLGGDNQPGFDLLALRVTNEAIPGSSEITASGISWGNKPVFFLMANIHAREITTPEIAMRFLDWLLDNYRIDADVTWLVDWHEIWIVPTVNPDGHWLVELGTQDPYNSSPFSQRKNANRDVNNDSIPDCGQWPPFSFAQYGIDLNRNHSFGWGLSGSSNEPCDLTYRGPAEASEVEVNQLQELVRDLIPDQRGTELSDAAPLDTTGILISLHSYSNLVLWPWGFAYQPAPNCEDLKAIGDRLAEFNGYTSCQPTECLYAASGASDDWAYGELGIPAFTFEIGDEFMPPYSEIDLVQWPDNKPALSYAARIARTPYVTIKGPEVSDIQVNVWSPEITVTATIDDTLNGSQPIAAAAVSIDLPYWAENSLELPLDAADGDFDSVMESFSSIVDVSDLSPGRHMVYIRGQDQAGNWGPISAAYFDLVSEPKDRLFLPAVTRP
jgi:hypothetical protein